MSTTNQHNERAELLDSMLTRIINRRVAVEQELFDMASGKKPMPDAGKLRELALKLGDPATVEAAAMLEAQQMKPLTETQNPKIGDYVLATKYSDGDPGDPWALGFYAGLDTFLPSSPRHMVNDSDGKTIRHNGYRRVARIRKDVGAWLLNVAAKQLEQSPPGTVNLWTMLSPSAFEFEQDEEAAHGIKEQA